MSKLRKEISKMLEEALSSEEQSFTGTSTPSQGSEKPSGPIRVRFNKGLESEYIVTFSERGFLIGNTRMSFEEMDNALSKRYTITLEDGTVLDAVKMQQIMKYENIY